MYKTGEILVAKVEALNFYDVDDQKEARILVPWLSRSVNIVVFDTFMKC